MEEVIVFFGFITVVLAIILSRFYLKLQELKLKHSSGADGNDLQKQMKQVLAENEAIKEELQDIKYLLSSEKKRIDLDYEKEQILIDKQNKFDY